MIRIPVLLLYCVTLIAIRVNCALSIIEIQPIAIQPANLQSVWQSVKVYNNDTINSVNLSTYIFWSSQYLNRGVTLPTQPNIHGVGGADPIILPLSSVVLLNGDNITLDIWKSAWSSDNGWRLPYIKKTSVYLVKPWPLFRAQGDSLLLWDRPPENGTIFDHVNETVERIDYYQGPTNGWPIIAYTISSVYLKRLNASNRSLGSNWYYPDGIVVTENCNSSLTIHWWSGVPCPQLECDPGDQEGSTKFCVDAYRDCTQRCNQHYHSCGRTTDICYYDKLNVTDTYIVPINATVIVNITLMFYPGSTMNITTNGHVSISSGGCLLLPAIGEQPIINVDCASLPSKTGTEFTLISVECVVGENYPRLQVVGICDGHETSSTLRECERYTTSTYYKPGSGLVGLALLDTSGCGIGGLDSQTTIAIICACVSVVVVGAIIFIMVALKNKKLRKRLFPFRDYKRQQTNVSRTATGTTPSAEVHSNTEMSQKTTDQHV